MLNCLFLIEDGQIAFSEVGERLLNVGMIKVVETWNLILAIHLG
jgi:hypothetical protein